MSLDKKDKIKSNKIFAGIALSVGVGLAIGTSMGNVGAGLAVGIALGITFGVSMQKKNTLKKVTNRYCIQVY